MDSKNEIVKRSDEHDLMLAEAKEPTFFTPLKKSIRDGLNRHPRPLNIDVNLIVVEKNIRTIDTTSEAFSALKESIKEDGLLHPITVRYNDIAENFTIISGHRRYEAVLELGFSKIASMVNLEEEVNLRIQVLENVLREDLSPIEYCDSLKGLVDKYSYTPSDLSRRLGIDPSKASACLGIAKEWDKRTKDSVMRKNLTLSKLIELHKKRSKTNLGREIEKLENKDKKKKMTESSPVFKRYEKFISQNEGIEKKLKLKMKNLAKTYEEYSNKDKSDFKSFLSMVFPPK